MYILRISNITKRYDLGENKSRTVLDNVSLMFPETGLFAIIGKSGSGKSTLMNMISMMDEPTNGCVYFNNENIHKWSKKRKIKYRNEDIGIIFQNYHLLENETALFNIMLPALIGGKSQKEAEFAAKNLLKSINFNEKLYNQKCRDLSGGEKERIAILRALINNPRIILADEPTGALDSKNSIIIMDMLKEISKDRLVILVSHNLDLVKEYADTIVTIRDGKIDNVEEKNNVDTKGVVKENKKNVVQKKAWINSLTRSNFKRRFKRNIISICALVIGLVSTMLIIGFSNGSKASVKNRSYKQLDYGVATLYKETSQNVPGSKISLVQMTRPSFNEIPNIKIDDFYIEPNFDTLLSSYPIIKSGDSILEELSFVPVYSYQDNSFEDDLLINGEKPKVDSLSELVINKTAYDYLKKTFKSEPLGLTLTVHSDYEYHYYTDEVTNPVITDYFIFDKTIKIVGVVDNFNFLSTPKIYYPYLALKEYLEETILVNLSTYLDTEVTWYEQVMFCDGGDSLGSYSYRLFLKDNNKIQDLEQIINDVEKPYKIDSTPLTLSQTLLDLMNAATIGMELFLAIAIIGTALILGIISFSSYSEDKKTSAILTCLGASKDDIFTLYLNENLSLGLISLAISLILSPFLMLGINKLISSLTTFENMISIPFLSFLEIPFLFPLILVIATISICIFSTYIPLFFSKRISPKEELAEE